VFGIVTGHENAGHEGIVDDLIGHVIHTEENTTESAGKWRAAGNDLELFTIEEGVGIGSHNENVGLHAVLTENLSGKLFNYISKCLLVVFQLHGIIAKIGGIEFKICCVDGGNGVPQFIDHVEFSLVLQLAVNGVGEAFVNERIGVFKAHYGGQGDDGLKGPFGIDSTDLGRYALGANGSLDATGNGAFANHTVGTGALFPKQVTGNQRGVGGTESAGLGEGVGIFLIHKVDYGIRSFGLLHVHHLVHDGVDPELGNHNGKYIAEHIDVGCAHATFHRLLHGDELFGVFKHGLHNGALAISE